MVWFKVDDKFHDHWKSRRAKLEAVGLWTFAGSWSSDNLTDGFVPAEVLTRWHPRPEKIAQRLVDAGLWERVEVNGEVGYQFHEWEAHQPTKAEVEDRRAKRAAAGRTGGLASAQARGQASASARAQANLNEPGTPTRPDPTRPKGGSWSRERERSSKPTRATPLPPPVLRSISPPLPPEETAARARELRSRLRGHSA